MKQLTSCIGHAAKLSDFPLNDLTPEFEYYADDVEDRSEGTPDEIKEALFVQISQQNTHIQAYTDGLALQSMLALT